MAGGKKKLKTNDQLKISPSTALLKPVKGFRINVISSYRLAVTPKGLSFECSTFWLVQGLVEKNILIYNWDNCQSSCTDRQKKSSRL